MIDSSKPERRRHERFPQVVEVHTRCLVSSAESGDAPKDFDGRIQNLSNGGVCILSGSPLPPSLFVCCSFPVIDAPVQVPILMQVRWTAKRGYNPSVYVSGLQFVL